MLSKSRQRFTKQYTGGEETVSYFYRHESYTHQLYTNQYEPSYTGGWRNFCGASNLTPGTPPNTSTHYEHIDSGSKHIIEPSPQVPISSSPGLPDDEIVPSHNDLVGSESPRSNPAISSQPQADVPANDIVGEYVEEHDIMLMADNTRVHVVKMRSDGDCLFASITHQVGSYSPYSPGHRAEIVTAREATVAYLQENWEKNLSLKYNIIDSLKQSRLNEYLSPNEKDQVEEYLNNLKEGKEWGGIETFKALAEHYNVSIKVFVEDRQHFSVRPDEPDVISDGGNEAPPEIMVAFRKAILMDDHWNHYDSVLRYLPNNEKSSETESPSALQVDSKYAEVKQFFTTKDWMSYSETEHDRFKNIYDRYLEMHQKNFKLKKPYFVIEHEKRKDNEKKKAEKAEMKRVKSKPAALPTRRSARSVCNENTDKVNKKKMQPTIAVSPTNSMGEDSPPTPSSSRLDKPEENKRKVAPLRSKTVKRPRLFGMRLVYPTELPKFGKGALFNLNEPPHTRNISPILRDCKHFLREKIKDDFLDKSEYDAFARTMVEKYTLLKTEGAGQSWWSFKKSLSASFRDDRKKKKDPENKTSKLKVMECHGIIKESAPHSEEDKMKELREAKEKKLVAKLLVETKDIRRETYRTLSSSDKIKTYSHLKDPEMMLLDYLTMNDFTLEDLEENSLSTINLIGKHYGIDVSTEEGKMLALMEMHSYFMSTAVKKGAKPVFTIVDKQPKMDSLLSSSIQSPFLVVYIKDNPFVHDCKEFKAAATSMEGSLLIAINKSPSAVRCMILLIAAYIVFDLEYPFAYMEFLRALERYVTGSVVESKYGNTRKKFDSFNSMIKNVQGNNKKTRRKAAGKNK